MVQVASGLAPVLVWVGIGGEEPLWASSSVVNGAVLLRDKLAVLFIRVICQQQEEIIELPGHPLRCSID